MSEYPTNIFGVAKVVTKWGIPEFDQFFVPKPTFKVQDLPDQSGRVFIVTGGYTGIGEESVKVLLKKNAKVYIAGRSQKKFDDAFVSLGADEERLRFLELDLSSVQSCKFAAAKFLTLEKRLDVLINNAGVAMPPLGSRTKDGYELQWGTNVLGHFAFTIPLLPLLESTISLPPNSGHPGRVRIINISSAANQFAPPEGVDWTDDMKRGSNPGKWYNPPWIQAKEYGQSKLGNISFTNGLAKRYPNILSLAAHPGVISTGLYRNVLGGSLMIKVMASVEYGALTGLYEALSEDLTLEHNAWYGRPWGRMFPRAQHWRAKDEQLDDEVWTWCEKEFAKF